MILSPGGLKRRGPFALWESSERPLSERREDMPLSDRERPEGFRRHWCLLVADSLRSHSKPPF